VSRELHLAEVGRTNRKLDRKAWPNYALSLAGAPLNRARTGPDRSMADFTWCMTAIDWGWNIEETARKLPKVCERARQRVEQLRDEGYPLITAQNAAAEVERNDQQQRAGVVGISNYTQLYRFPQSKQGVECLACKPNPV
jgi:hypothetical protein